MNFKFQKVKLDPFFYLLDQNGFIDFGLVENIPIPDSHLLGCLIIKSYPVLPISLHYRRVIALDWQILVSQGHISSNKLRGGGQSCYGPTVAVLMLYGAAVYILPVPVDCRHRIYACGITLVQQS